MSTPAIIAVKTGDMLRTIYCHNNGYLYGVGRCLLDHYNTQDAAEHLVALGDLSSVGPRLAPEAGEPHTFNRPAQGVTVSYRRDRGEEGNEAFTFNLKETPLEEIVENLDDSGYLYVFMDGQWFYRTESDSLECLTVENTRAPWEHKDRMDTPKEAEGEGEQPEKSISEYISMAADLRYHKSKLAEAEQVLDLEIMKRRQAEEKLKDAEEDLATMQNRLVRMFTAPSDPNGFRGLTKEFWVELLGAAQEAGLCVMVPGFGEAYHQACQRERGR